MSTGRPREPSAADEERLRRQAKAALRRRMKGLRATVPADARWARAQAAATRVVEMEAFTDARTLLAYAPIGAEMSPAPVVDAARGAGKVVALPRIDFEAGALRLHRWNLDTPLERGGFGVPEPPADAPPISEAEVDLVIVPALAADTHGHRLGYGKGFYDQLLPTLPRAVRIGLVYDFQVLTELPSTPGDVPLHVVASDARVIAVEEPCPDGS